MDAGLLDKAVGYIEANDTHWSRDLTAEIRALAASEPHSEIIGPVKDRGGTNSLVLRHGYIVAEWGDTKRVDMSFSLSKSYLSTVAGLALDQGLIRNVHDPVRDYVDDGGFDPPHNYGITWDHLLQQTSEWTGTLWGKPHHADRPDPNRKLREPGRAWVYN